MLDTARVVPVEPGSKLRICMNCIYWAPSGFHKEGTDCAHPSTKSGLVDAVTGRQVYLFSAAEMRSDATMCGKEGKLWTKDRPPLTGLSNSSPAGTRSKKTIDIDDI